MADDVDNFTHEWMRRQDRRMDLLMERIDSMASLQHQMHKNILALRRDMLANDEAAAQQQLEHERLVARVERIERRLDLADEPKG